MILHTFKDTTLRLPAKKISRLFDIITKNETRTDWNGAVNLIFTTDRKIRRLNREYRGLDRVTDVLSFNIETPEQPDSTFGEIYISAAAAARQARERGLALSDEYLRLVCHGLLHLLGYDHEKWGEKKIMQKRESDYLAQLQGSSR